MQPHIQFKPAVNELCLLDQRLLPGQEEWFVCRNMADLVSALKDMVVRGAPAIGVTAAYGCCLAAANADPDDAGWRRQVDEELAALTAARSTAVNLAWAVNIMRQAWAKQPDMPLMELRTAWNEQALALLPLTSPRRS